MNPNYQSINSSNNFSATSQIKEQPVSSNYEEAYQRYLAARNSYFEQIKGTPNSAYPTSISNDQVIIKPSTNTPIPFNNSEPAGSNPNQTVEVQSKSKKQTEKVKSAGVVRQTPVVSKDPGTNQTFCSNKSMNTLLQEYIKLSVAADKLADIIGVNKEDISNAKAITDCLSMRDKYICSERCSYNQEALITKPRPNSTEPLIDYLDSKIEIPGKLANCELKWESGIFIPIQDGQPLIKPIQMSEYFKDLFNLEKYAHDGALRAFCRKRLEILDIKFKVHQIYNIDKEAEEAKKENHRDFYNVRKVDTHIHLAACFPIRKFMRFIENKLITEPDTIVIEDPKTKEKMTLKQVFDGLGITARTIDIDSLDMQADCHTFQRFDNFNKKYNPLDQGQLRNIFLQSDNALQGRFLAEMTKKLMHHFEEERYEFMEWRISIHGKSLRDANRVADWIAKYNLFSHNNRWLIQVPRLYASYRHNGLVKNFAQMIQNIFKPLFEVTLDPSSNPNLFRFLLQVTGFDSVDDESTFETTQSEADYLCNPDNWDKEQSPPYCYWNFYFYSNIQALNKLRKARGLNTFLFRPHCGEAGPTNHLSSSYLLADGISHGIRVSKSPVLEYLYYLKQIGLAISPISNNKLFVKYHKNPFPRLFARGLNVSLSTDDPLILHSTNDSLLEEYAVASEIWGLTPVDLCELARNSVVQSGYEETLKKHWIGEKYNEKTIEANDITKTNIPNTRFQFRIDNLNEEFEFIQFLNNKEK